VLAFWKNSGKAQYGTQNKSTKGMQAYSNLSKHEEKWEEIKRIPEII
jgi:hypothetical protein